MSNIHNSLKIKGKLIINEFVGENRLQYKKHQIKEINKCLRLIDKEYKTMFKVNICKNSYYGSGILRMIISDPSECIESKSILTTIHSKFSVIEEKGYGGNLLMPVLKDISHHFLKMNDKKEKCLENIFEFEDKYLEKEPSDFVFIKNNI